MAQGCANDMLGYGNGTFPWRRPPLCLSFRSQSREPPQPGYPKQSQCRRHERLGIYWENLKLLAKNEGFWNSRLNVIPSLCCSCAKNGLFPWFFEILKHIKSQTENMTQSSFRTWKSREALSLWSPRTILVLLVGIFGGCWSLPDLYVIPFVWCGLSGISRRASHRRAGLHSAQSVLGHRLWMRVMYLWIIEIRP